MADLSGREIRLFDLSSVRDSRYKGAGIHVDDVKRARCSAIFCEWIVSANTAHGGKSPFPYGLYMLDGKTEEIQDPPQELTEGAFLEVIPCDRPDRRAAKLTWNETGTQAEFSFAALSSILGIAPPKGTTLWIEAVDVKDLKGKPVAALPLGEKIKRQAVQQTAATKQDGAPQ
jgi:hypothetical protein